jgi:hypothetical protein
MCSIDMVNTLQPGILLQAKHVTRSSTARTQVLESCQLSQTAQETKFFSSGIIAML